MPRAFLVTRPIVPQRVREDKVRFALLTMFNKIGSDIRKDFQKTTETWTHKVKFQLDRTISGRSQMIGVGVYTDDPIWNYLNSGTDVRFVVMRDSFEPKTTPDSFSSGSGHSSEPIPGIIRQMPGIEARGWTDLAQRKYENRFFRESERAMLAGLENQRI